MFSAAVESASYPIITKSLDGTITGWNPAAERLYGYTAAEAIGRNIDLIVPADRRQEQSDMIERSLAYIEQCQKDGMTKQEAWAEFCAAVYATTEFHYVE